jgi:hypothetical protein
VTLEWIDLTYTVVVGKGKAAKLKTILYSVSGRVRPGSLLAVMGPTGASSCGGSARAFCPVGVAAGSGLPVVAANRCLAIIIGRRCSSTPTWKVKDDCSQCCWSFSVRIVMRSLGQLLSKQTGC